MLILSGRFNTIFDKRLSAIFPIHKLRIFAAILLNSFIKTLVVLPKVFFFGKHQYMNLLMRCKQQHY